jgi:hypothetical protein
VAVGVDAKGGAVVVVVVEGVVVGLGVTEVVVGVGVGELVEVVVDPTGAVTADAGGVTAVVG